MLNLQLSDEQRLLVDSVARLFEAESTPARIRAAEGIGFDADLWDTLVNHGVPNMRAPQDCGGAGLTLLDALLVGEEAGRRLATVPLAETLSTNRLLGQLNHGAQGSLVTLALHPVVAGRRQLVPCAARAEAIIALDGDELVLLKGYAAEQVRQNGGGSALARVALSVNDFAGEREILAQGPDARNLFEASLEEWKLITAAMLAGAAAEALRLAAAYSHDRIQFGKPIGTFQALAHPLADSATCVDGARLLAWKAAGAVARSESDAAALISASLWWSIVSSDEAIARALRTFGGYGLSLEYDIQLYYRRAKALGLILGDPQRLLDETGRRKWQAEAPALPVTATSPIDFSWGQPALDYAAELRTFVDENVSPELRARFHHSTSGFDADFHRRLAAAGFLFPDMPAEYGGQGRSKVDVLAAGALWEEIGWTRVPMAVTEFVMKMVLEFGSATAKAEIVPRFVEGEALGCLGFSEPQSGSDIFAAKLSAVRDGDDWIINGSKMFTTGGHLADYILLLARTEDTGRNHEGLTMFVAPMKVPEVEVQAIYTLQDERTNITYFSNLRLSDAYRLGEVGGGLQVMHFGLGIEHGGMGYHHAFSSLIHNAEDWALSERSGGRPIEDSSIRQRLARAYVLLQISEVLNRRHAWAVAAGQDRIPYGPMGKLFATEMLRVSATDLVAAAAPDSLVTEDGSLGKLEILMRRALGMTIYGGTSEIHRTLIAQHFLGMPRSRG
jgi:alkylation response protein AidB-like acyl-CoA dehydrogenase